MCLPISECCSKFRARERYTLMMMLSNKLLTRRWHGCTADNWWQWWKCAGPYECYPWRVRKYVWSANLKSAKSRSTGRQLIAWGTAGIHTDLGCSWRPVFKPWFRFTINLQYPEAVILYILKIIYICTCNLSSGARQFLTRTTSTIVQACCLKSVYNTSTRWICQCVIQVSHGTFSDACKCWGICLYVKKYC